MKARTQKRRVNGNFEIMEGRRMFAADLMLNAAVAMEAEAPVERATFEAEQSSSVLDILTEGLPDPTDPDSPEGPLFSEVTKIRNVALAEVGSIGDGLLKPNPEDDDSPTGPLTEVGPIGDVGMPVVLLDGELVGEGESEGKPDDVDPDCDGNPLTATCDLTAEIPFEHAKPDDVDPDCDANPLTATCDLTAEIPFEHAKPDDVDPDCWHPLMASCDYQAEEPVEENETEDLPELLRDERELLTVEEDVKKEFAGDTDGDFDVDFSDFLQVSNNYGMTGGATRAQGDLTGDGNVNFADFLQVSNNYGNSLADIVDLVFADV